MSVRGVGVQNGGHPLAAQAGRAGGGGAAGSTIRWPRHKNGLSLLQGEVKNIRVSTRTVLVLSMLEGL